MEGRKGARKGGIKTKICPLLMQIVELDWGGRGGRGGMNCLKSWEE